MNLPDLLTKLYDYAYYGTLGAFAALVGYLYQVAKKGTTGVSWLMLLATAIFGFYLGMVFANLVPAGWDNRDALVLLAGASGMKGVELAIRAGGALIKGAVAGAKSPGPDGDGT